MAGIALLVANEEMYAQAKHVVSERENHICVLKQAATQDILLVTQEAISRGVEIVVARGKQAILIRENFNIPVIEIQLTAQELGLMIQEARQRLEKDFLSIGLFGWGNMFCNTDYFNDIFHVRLDKYTSFTEEEWRQNCLMAQKENYDVIFCSQAEVQSEILSKFPHICLCTTDESIQLAIDRAEELYRLLETEQKSQAQLSTLLYSSLNGIIKIDHSGNILLLNRSMEGMLDISGKNMLGVHISTLFPQLSPDTVRGILAGEQENYSGFIQYGNTRLVVVAEPLITSGIIDGAMIFCTRLAQTGHADQNIKEQFLKGNIALSTFAEMEQNFKGLRPVIERAKLYALSSSPVLIEASSGPELEMLAQSIHNGSTRRQGPFIMVSIAGMTEEQQSWALFGNPKTGDRGALLDANHGMLVIQSIDKLTLPLQYQLIRAIRTNRLGGDGNRNQIRVIDTRIIATTAKNLSGMRKKFLFRSDLLFTLKALRLRIPPLKDRPEDIETLLDFFVQDYCRKYSCYHILSEGARKCLLAYPWEGNMIQIQAFCERMVLTVQKRTISEEYVKGLLLELYEQDSGIFDVSQDQEPGPQEPLDERDAYTREWIWNALKAHGGNRKATAEALHMSTSTLWRKMKRYGIE